MTDLATSAIDVRPTAGNEARSGRSTNPWISCRFRDPSEDFARSAEIPVSPRITGSSRLVPRRRIEVEGRSHQPVERPARRPPPRRAGREAIRRGNPPSGAVLNSHPEAVVAKAALRPSLTAPLSTIVTRPHSFS